MAKAEANSTPPRVNGATPPVLQFPKPKVRRRRLVSAATRRRIEDAVERMIEVLDTIEAPNEDLEEEEPEEDDPLEDDGTEEPSLGSFDRLMNQEHGWPRSLARVGRRAGSLRLRRRRARRR